MRHIIFGPRDTARTYARHHGLRAPEIIESRFQLFTLDARADWKVHQSYGAHDPLIVDALRIFKLRQSGAPGMRDLNVS